MSRNRRPRSKKPVKPAPPQPIETKSTEQDDVAWKRIIREQILSSGLMLGGASFTIGYGLYAKDNTLLVTGVFFLAWGSCGLRDQLRILKNTF